MGLLDLLTGDRIHLDANIWIYSSEGVSAYSQSLIALFAAVDAGSLTLVTSELTLAEILVRPIRAGNTLEQETYIKAITNTKNSVAIPVERSILIRAAEIRSQTKLKLPDAIHAATAIAANCTTFLTNDKQFRTVPSLNVVLLAQAVAEPDSD